MGTDRAVHGRKHEIPVFVKNPVAFTVYREELQFSGIFPDNPVGLACMPVWDGYYHGFRQRGYGYIDLCPSAIAT